MRTRRGSGRCHALLLAGVLALTPARADTGLRPGLYDVSIEIGMPHLDENLRYATRRERRCIAGLDLASAFPVLEEPGLRHCRLEEGGANDGVATYVLRCAGDTSITGTAHWELARGRARGTLAVRLGGKNMTLSQRVAATRVDDCD